MTLITHCSFLDNENLLSLKSRIGEIVSIFHLNTRLGKLRREF